MSDFRDNLHLRDRMLDRALGFPRGLREEVLDRRVSEDRTTDVESYDRAAAAVHLALLPAFLLPIPAATFRRLKAQAEAIQRHGA